jgi:methionine sulfoxide reductase catalytic subunit
MLIRRAADIRSSDITDKRLYHGRREFLQAATATVAVAAAGIVGDEACLHAATPAPHGRKLENIKKSPLSTTEKPNTWEQITTYNNFYEFGTSYDSASTYGRSLKPEPWTVTVDGECNKKGMMNLEDVLKGKTLEEHASIAIAASSAGRWSSRGLGSHSRISSGNASRRRKRHTWSSRR